MCVCACVSVCVCVWVSGFLSVSMCASVCVWVVLCPCQCVWVCVCRCVRVNVCVCVRACARTGESLLVCVCVCARTSGSGMCVAMYLHYCLSLWHRCVCVCVCVCVSLFVFVCLCTWIYCCTTSNPDIHIIAALQHRISRCWSLWVSRMWSMLLRAPNSTRSTQTLTSTRMRPSHSMALKLKKSWPSRSFLIFDLQQSLFIRHDKPMVWNLFWFCSAWV